MNYTPRQLQIIDVALELIAEHGIQGFTVKRVAQKMGVTEPALYRHFETKNAIFHALIDRFEGETDIVVALVEAEKVRGWAAVECFVRSRFARVEADPRLARVMFSEEYFQEDAALSKRMIHMMHQHKRDVERWLEEAITSGEIRSDLPKKAMFRLIMGPVRLLIKQWSMSDFAFSIAEEGDELLCAMKTLFSR